MVKRAVALLATLALVFSVVVLSRRLSAFASALRRYQHFRCYWPGVHQ